MYKNRATRRHPGLFIIMVDQSEFMSNENVASGKSLAVIAADIINCGLTEMVKIATRPIGEDDEEVRDYQKVIIVGYGGNESHGSCARIIYDDWLSEITQYKRYIPTSFNDSLCVYEVIRPVSEGISPMSSAFELAKQVINEWKASGHDGSTDPSPIIINITNVASPTINMGYVTDESMTKTYEEAQAVMNISFPDGAPRICNIVLSFDNRMECMFPNNDLGFEGDSLMQFYFNISSKMPSLMRDRFGKTIKENSKLLIMGGNMSILDKCLVFYNWDGWIDWNSSKYAFLY